jgi:uncharacterized SAM-binding protein YcdF (DUF218 family)
MFSVPPAHVKVDLKLPAPTAGRSTRSPPRATRISGAAKIGAIALVALLCWIAAAPLLASYLIVEKPLHQADAILVLGGSSVYRERTKLAAELYLRGAAPKILLTDDGGKSGWSQTEQTNLPYVELARRNLVDQGVAPGAIEILEPHVSGTIDEARLLHSKVPGAGIKSLLLVTSAYHSRRALAAFEKATAGDSVEIGIQTAPTGGETPNPVSWWLSGRGWAFVGGEYVKSVFYWLYY